MLLANEERDEADWRPMEEKAQVVFERIKMAWAAFRAELKKLPKATDCPATESGKPGLRDRFRIARADWRFKSFLRELDACKGLLDQAHADLSYIILLDYHRQLRVTTAETPEEARQIIFGIRRDLNMFVLWPDLSPPTIMPSPGETVGELSAKIGPVKCKGIVQVIGYSKRANLEQLSK